MVSGAVRAVLYGACRGAARLGGRAAEAVADASRRLAAELVIRDEVDHRLRLLDAAQGPADGGSRGVPLEGLRQVHAELRRIAQQVPDGDLRGRLLDVAGRLTRLSAAHSEPGPPLAPRYLRSAMRKLGASTRFEAVVAARRQGLLP